jgi:hypothetical protein
VFNAVRATAVSHTQVVGLTIEHVRIEINALLLNNKNELPDSEQIVKIFYAQLAVVKPLPAKLRVTFQAGH